MSRRILLAEEDPFFGSILKRHLEHAGFDVLPALHGEAAVEMAQAELPQLLLLGMKLSRKDGWEVLEALRGSEEGSRLPIVILSALGSKEDVDRAFELGAMDYLIKSHHDVQEIVRRVQGYFVQL
jgi:DNA-binding response OmpR family regulator